MYGVSTKTNRPGNVATNGNQTSDIYTPLSKNYTERNCKLKYLGIYWDLLPFALFQIKKY